VPEEDPGGIEQVGSPEPPGDLINPLIRPPLPCDRIDHKGDQRQVDQPPNRKDIARRHEQDRELVGNLTGGQSIQRERVGQKIDREGHDQGNYHDDAIGLHFIPPVI